MELGFEAGIGFGLLFGLWSSERVVITCRRVNRDLLISIAYFAIFPYVPVNPIL